MIHLLTEGGNSELKNRIFPLPKNLKEYLTNLLKNYKGDKTEKGFKRLNNLVNNHNGVTYQEMKRLKNFFDNYKGKTDAPIYQLNGGDNLKFWVNITLNNATQAINDFKRAKKDAGIKNAFRKTHSKDRAIKPKKTNMPKIKTDNLGHRMLYNDNIKYESINHNKKTIKLSESQIRALNEAMDDTFSLKELSNISTFKGRYKYCLQHFKNHQGKGSSRCVFQIDDEKILKLAINEKGLYQNDVENDYYLQKNYYIFPKIYDADENNKWLISEFVLPAKLNDFKQCLGIDFEEFEIFLNTSWANSHGNKRNMYLSLMSKERYVELLENNEDLAEFDEYIANYNVTKEMLGDMKVLHNYGLTIRYGNPTIVLLDSGLNEYIWNNFYKR